MDNILTYLQLQYSFLHSVQFNNEITVDYYSQYFNGELLKIPKSLNYYCHLSRTVIHICFYLSKSEFPLSR